MRRTLAALAAVLCIGATQAPSDVALKALLSATPAPTLAAYRLFTDEGAHHPNAGVTPYTLNDAAVQRLCGEEPLSLPAAGNPRGLSPERRAGPSGGRDPDQDLRLSGRDFRRPSEKVRMIETCAC